MQVACGRNINALAVGDLLQHLNLLIRKNGRDILEALLALIQGLEVEVHEHSHEGAEDLEGNADAHGGAVVGLVRVVVGIRGPDGSGVADTVDEGVGCGALCRWTGDCTRDPGVNSAVLGEDEDHEEEGEVAGPEAVCSHEDDEADDCDGDRVDEEPEAVLEAVGEI